MLDFEKPGSFYLGKRHDAADSKGRMRPAWN